MEDASTVAEGLLDGVLSIDGAFRAGAGERLPVVNPATGARIGEIAAATSEEVDAAVAAAIAGAHRGDDDAPAGTEPADVETGVLKRPAKVATREKWIEYVAAATGRPAAEFAELTKPQLQAIEV